MALDSDQRKVLNAILSIGRRRGATPKEIKAAIETGLVESNLANLSGGDADSAGWRQERASIYKNPTNLTASINRFFDETRAVRGKYGRAGDLAAAVQRPAAQYRGRYQQRSGEAQQLLGGRASGGAGSGSGSTDGLTRSTTTTTPGVDNRLARAQLISTFLTNHHADPLEFATQARALRDIAPTSNTETVRIPGAPRQPSSRSSASSGSGRFKIDGPHPGRLKPQLTSFAKQVADVFGGTLEGLDGSSHSKFTVNGNVSQHYTGNATDIFKINGKPARGALLIAAGRAALEAAGMPASKARKAPGGLYNVGSHQIIFGVSGVANGGDHTDHLHISAR